MMERTSSSGGSSAEKVGTQRVEQIHTNERVPGHDNYYEKDGLRTYGDGEGSLAHATLVVVASR